MEVPKIDSFRALVKWLNSAPGQLARIEILVIIAAGLNAFLQVFGSYRRRSNSSLLKFVLWTAYTLSDLIVAYTIGLMQSADFKNELFMIWGSFLIIVLGSANSISAYSLDDVNQWVRQFANQLLQMFYAAWLLSVYSEGSKFNVPMSVIWGLSVLRSVERLGAFRLAGASFGLQTKEINTTLVADYMKYEHTLSGEADIDPKRMIGYKYLVAGEEGQVEGSRMRVKITDEVITVEKIWQCPGRLLNSTQYPGGRFRDICLSFALFKLLRRRFAGYPCLEVDLPKTRALVLQGLISGEDYRRAFQVVEVELAFLYDHFYTKYPIIFAMGWKAFLVTPAMLVASCWVAVILISYQAREGEEHLLRSSGQDIDVVVTFFVVFAIILLEIWQIIAYVFSDWAKVGMLCKYVEDSVLREIKCVEKVIGCLCQRRVLKPWANKMGQHSFLHSFDRASLLTRIREIREGGIIVKPVADDPITVPEEVKKALVSTLEANGGGLTIKMSVGLFSWACRFETLTETIWVWHLATGFCEIETSRSEDGVNPEVLRNLVVARSLSRYCSYLACFIPELIGDSRYAMENAFRNLIMEARAIRKPCSSLEEMIDRMMVSEGQPQYTPLLNEGVKLGKQLKIIDDMQRWNLLAEFWAEMMLYLAPSEKDRTHAEHLADGGELITHLWALLSHAGILNRPATQQIV